MSQPSLKKVDDLQTRKECLAELQKPNIEIVVSHISSTSYKLKTVGRINSADTVYLEASAEFFAHYKPQTFYSMTVPISIGVLFFKILLQQTAEDMMVFSFKPLEAELYLVQRRKDFRTVVDESVQLSARVGDKIFGRVIDLSLSGFALFVTKEEFERLGCKKGNVAEGLSLWMGSTLLDSRSIVRNVLLSKDKVKVGFEFSAEDHERAQLIQQVILDVYRRFHLKRFK